MAAQRGFFSERGTRTWKHIEAGGKYPSIRHVGKRFDLQRNARPGKGEVMTESSSHKNHPSRYGGRITAMWIPENARLKNMRPRFELFNTPDAEALGQLRSSKRLIDTVDTSESRRQGMPDGVRLSRSLAEELHQLSYTPVLHRQYDSQRQQPPPFPDTRAGQPQPSPPVADFPRFYDREQIAELDHWQAATNAKRFNPNAEFFIYFHFWAHDDDWVHRRRIDAWDYVKSVCAEYLGERLESLQRQLYGGRRDYVQGPGGAQGQPQLGMHLSGLEWDTAPGAGSRPTGSARITVWRTDRKLGRPAGARIRWRSHPSGSDPVDPWREDHLDSDGCAPIEFRVWSLQPTAVELEVDPGDGSPTHGWTQVLDTKGAWSPAQVNGGHLPLQPPEDLRRAMPGCPEEEVVRVYRQELQVLEEELVNTLVNLDAIMQPSPILYACQNELNLMAAAERLDPKQAWKEFDWWFHHQSFALYLPVYDEALLKRLLNWRHTINTVIGNSPWLDQVRQFSPQPVNCLMQVWRKHNCVWDSRVFRVEHDLEAQFQEEHNGEWSFFEHRPEPQPTPPAHLREQQPRPLSEKAPRDILYGTDRSRDELWSALAHHADPLRVPGQPEDYAQDYFADTFTARRAAGVEIHPSDQPGLEVDVEPAIPAVPAAERGKYIRRLGKLYRWYFNPYHPWPVRHRPYMASDRDRTDWWW
eukprot:TRINITY_DN65594_c0_g1_i1.p2 TRINITY_DN65594_c0_g1~~TRINITY_DN65594_c0_g1_i1.p2  ORF type:complete len:697 (+),score=224.76 TRINITY_DN65594_c0_g1_i1:135-2225(+)